MKKRLLLLVVAVIFAFACAVLTVACGSGNDNGHKHSFINYVYNNDGTCVKDGTETAKCETCEETHTRISAAHRATGEHSYDGYVCDVCGEYAPNAPLTEGLRYEEVKENDVVVGYSVKSIGTALDDEILIPATYNDKPVVGISDYAFRGCGMTRLVMPNSIERIGARAFMECHDLVTIKLSNRITTIVAQSFYDCDSLMSIDLPDSVTNIGDSAFSGCSDLMSIEISDAIYYIGQSVFSSCAALVIYCEKTEAPSDWDPHWNSLGCPVVWDHKNNDKDEKGYAYTVEQGVRYKLKDGAATVTIQSSTLSGAVILPSSVTYKDETYSVTGIDENAFGSRGYNISSIEIPCSVTSIGMRAFYICSRLTLYCELTEAPSGWSGGWNYSECPVVWDCKNNDLDEEGNAYAVINGLRYSFKDDVATVSLQPQSVSGSIVIPSSVTYDETVYPVTSISPWAFYGCGKITQVTIPYGIRRIEDRTFSGSGLTEVNIPSSVTYIGYSAFGYCNLTSVKIPDGVTTLGERAFECCYYLTEIELPASLERVSEKIFSGCNALLIYGVAPEKPLSQYWSSRWLDDDDYRLSFPVIWNCRNSNTDEDGYEYTVVDGLRYAIKDGVASVFRQSPVLSGAVAIPSDIMYNDRKYSVVGIEKYAFYRCSLITSVEIPLSVVNMGDDVFEKCSNLSTIYCEAPERPSDWSSSFNSVGNSSCPVVWDYKNQ